MPTGKPNAPEYLHVEPGEQWQVGEAHRFACGDVVAGTDLDRLISGPRIDLLWSDPPWIDGQAKLYHGMSGLSDAELHPAQTILCAVVRPAQRRHLLAYVEVGLPTVEAFRATLEALGAVITGQWTITCYRREIALLAADWRPEPAEDHPDFRGLDDADAPRVAMVRRGSRGVVLDPCCGLGKTSRAAALAGWSSLNHDLVPDRVARAMESLSRLTGAEARLAAARGSGAPGDRRQAGQAASRAGQ